MYEVVLCLASAADIETDAISQLAIVAAVHSPSMRGKPERRLAATKHSHTHFERMRAHGYSPTLSIKNAGFQWFSTHIIELQEGSSKMHQSISLHHLYCYMCI